MTSFLEYKPGFDHIRVWHFFMLDSVLKWGVSSGWSFCPGSLETATIRKQTTAFFPEVQHQQVASELEISFQPKKSIDFILLQKMIFKYFYWSYVYGWTKLI